MNFFWITVLLFLTEVNSEELNPVITSEKKLTETHLNFVQKVNENFLLLKSMKWDSDHCVEYISDKIRKIDSFSSNSFFPKDDLEIKELKEKGLETLRKLFEIRNLIRFRQKILLKKNRLNYECLQSIKTGARYIRFMEEMLLEWLIDQKVLSNDEQGVLRGHFPQVMSDQQLSEFNDDKLQSGDLLLIRDDNYIGAMIARIGDAEVQFNHLGIVGLSDEKEKVVIESSIPYGIKITNLKNWLSQKIPRVSVFRFEEPLIAKNSADVAFKTSPVPYDFNFNSQDQSQIYSSELIENAFLKGSNFKIHLPEFKTLVTKFKSTVFLKNLGIQSDLLFLPGDIEFDTRFQLIADYRYLGKSSKTPEVQLLRKIRMQDAIIQSLYNWMIVENFQFSDDWFSKANTYFFKAMRFFGIFENQFPTHIPLKTLSTLLQFEQLSQYLEKPLNEHEKDFYSKNGHSLHFQEMMIFLDKFKNKECSQINSKLSRMFKSQSCK